MKRNTKRSEASLAKCLAAGVIMFAVLCSCGKAPQPASTETDDSERASEVVLKDYGKEPAVLNIETYTLSNENFRQVLWTGTNLQLTLMTIPVGGDIGLEVHTDIDQFLRIEKGKGLVMMGDTEDNLTFSQVVEDDFAVLVPAGKWHNIVNQGDEPLKLYSIYAPVEHPHGTVHKTQADDTDHH